MGEFKIEEHSKEDLKIVTQIPLCVFFVRNITGFYARGQLLLGGGWGEGGVQGGKDLNSQ